MLQPTIKAQSVLFSPLLSHSAPLSLIVRRDGGRSSVSGIIATVYGSTGFIGRYIVSRLGSIGSQMVVAFRGEESDFNHLKVMGDLGQIVPQRFVPRDEETLERIARRSNVAINLIGRWTRTRNYTLDEGNHIMAERVARAAKRAGVERFIHFSALGASHDAKSEFLRVKARSEEAVLREFPAATIVRPAITTGWEDNFLLKWARVCKTWPMVPIPTPSGYVQPIDVGDLAEAVLRILEAPGSPGQIYELAGPEIKPLPQAVDEILEFTKQKIPAREVSADTMKKIANATQNFMRRPSFTKEEIEYMQEDVTVKKKPGVYTIQDLGIEPIAMRKRMKDYIFHFRPPHEMSSL